MYKLVIQPEAKEDIRSMIREGGNTKKAAIRILAFLEDLSGNQNWLNELLTRKFQNEDFNVDKYVEFWDAGLDLWRIAVYEFNFHNHKKWTLPFRVMYGYDMESRAFRVLGILPREFNYDPNHELTKRIRRSYDDLGLPKHRLASARPGCH